MSQSLSKIWTHLIFSTKERYPFLSDESVRRDMHAYLASILKANSCPTLVVGGVSDHVHAFLCCRKTIQLRVSLTKSNATLQSGSKRKRLHCGSFIGKAAT